MQGRKNQIEALISRLQNHGAKLMGLELGEPMADGLADIIVQLGGAKAPADLLDLYREIDGAAVMWNVRDDAGELAGGFNLQALGVAMARNAAESDGEPLEGILWTGEEQPERLALLKRMVIFDSVPGRNDFVTFLIEDPTRVYLVADGEPTELHCSLTQTLDAIIEYGGADSLRTHLTHADWRKRIAADPELERLRKL